MASSEAYKIDLKALEEGQTVLEFDLDDAFFQSLEAAEVQHGCLHTTLAVNRIGDCFDLNFHTIGSVVVPCDLCLDDMDQPIEADCRMAAKFGESYSEEDDLVTVAEEEGILDIAWFVYESIELNIHIKNVPAPGNRKTDMISMLEAHSDTRSSGDEDQAPVDPRWEELSALRLEE